jgi:hypothetical protein
MRPRTWLRLDAALRYWDYYPPKGDQGRQLSEAAWSGSDPLALLLVACSGDGRDRQRAVNTRPMITDERLLPVLAIRTADWAQPVRNDARRLLPSALDAANADGLIRAVGVAMAMRDWYRGGHAVAAVTEALRTRSDGTLAAARTSDDLAVRRLAHRLWVESARADPDALVASALSEKDIICQRLSVDAVVRAAVHDRQRDALDRLLAARFARVRVEALAGLVQIGHPEVGKAFLTDPSAMMRATAQWAMRRAGRDAAEHCRAVLRSADGPSVRGAIAGLGECGAVDDADLVARYLRHDRPRVRAEAVRAVRRLGGVLGPFVDMLTDPAPVVVRAVVDAVLGQPGLVAIERLWELLAPDQPDHVRRAAFRLLIARDTWTRIEADLRLVGDQDEQLGAYASLNLTSWLESATAYQMPPDATRERLGRLIAAAEPNIDGSQAHRLRLYLGI